MTQDGGDRLAVLGIAGPIGAASPGHFHPLVQQIGHVDGAGGGRFRAQNTLKPIGPAPRMTIRAASRHIAQPHGVQPDRQWLHQRRLVQSHGVGDGKTIGGGHHAILGHAPRAWPGAAHELQVAAGVRPAHAALVARAADHRRIDGHAIAGPQMLDLRPRLDHRAGAFVAYGGRIYQFRFADPPVEVVMDVGAAHAHPVDPQQHVIGPIELRLGQLDDFQFLQAGEVGGFHVVPFDRRTEFIPFILCYRWNGMNSVLRMAAKAMPAERQVRHVSGLGAEQFGHRGPGAAGEEDICWGGS